MLEENPRQRVKKVQLVIGQNIYKEGYWFCIQEVLMRYIDERFHLLPSDSKEQASKFWYYVNKFHGVIGEGLSQEEAHKDWNEKFNQCRVNKLSYSSNSLVIH